MIRVNVEVFDGEYISGWSVNDFIYLKFEATNYLFTIPVNIEREDGFKGFEFQIDSSGNGDSFIICDESHAPLIDKIFLYKKYNNKVIQDTNENFYLVESRDLNIYEIISNNLEYNITNSAKKNIDIFIKNYNTNNKILIIPDKLNFLLSKHFYLNNIFSNIELVDYDFSIDSFIKNDSHISDVTICSILNNTFSINIESNFVNKEHIGDLSRNKLLVPQLNMDTHISLSRINDNYEIYGNTNSCNCDFIIIGKSTAEKFAKILAHKFKVIYINSKEFRIDLIKSFKYSYSHLLYVVPQRFFYSYFKIIENT